MKHTTGRIELRKRHPDFRINQKMLLWMSLKDTAKDWERNLPTSYTKIQSVSALQKTILLHAIRITSLFISFLPCKINVCRFVCTYLIFNNFIFILCYPIVTLKNWWKEFGSAPPFMICTNTRQESIKKEKKDICMPLKRTKNKKEKEQKRKERVKWK